MSAYIEWFKKYATGNEAEVAKELTRLQHELAVRNDTIKYIMDWLNSHTMYMVVDHSYSFAEIDNAPNVPVLASVSKRIWYHATDDEKSELFSDLIYRRLEERVAGNDPL